MRLEQMYSFMRESNYYYSGMVYLLKECKYHLTGSLKYEIQSDKSSLACDKDEISYDKVAMYKLS